MPNATPPFADGWDDGGSEPMTDEQLNRRVLWLKSAKVKQERLEKRIAELKPLVAELEQLEHELVHVSPNAAGKTNYHCTRISVAFELARRELCKK